MNEEQKQKLAQLIESTQKWMQSEEGKIALKKVTEEIHKQAKEREFKNYESRKRLAELMHKRITI